MDVKVWESERDREITKGLMSHGVWSFSLLMSTFEWHQMTKINVRHLLEVRDVGTPFSDPKKIFFHWNLEPKRLRDVWLLNRCLFEILSVCSNWPKSSNSIHLPVLLQRSLLSRPVKVSTTKILKQQVIFNTDKSDLMLVITYSFWPQTLHILV